MDRSDVMVEYSPVIIGGKAYICHKKYHASRQRSVADIHRWGTQPTVYAPFKTILTDITYDNDHEFRPTLRVLSGFTPGREIDRSLLRLGERLGVYKIVEDLRH